MATEPYVSANFKVTAKFFDSGVEVSDIVSVSASFALNTIPTATLIMAVGWNPITAQAASIHKLKKTLKARERVVVTLEILKGSGNTTKLQPGKYVIFDGFLAGIGMQRSHSQFNYVLNLVHWLSDLNNSSMIHGNWFPGAPQDYAAAAVVDILTAAGMPGANTQSRVGVNTPGAALQIADSLFNYGNITTDLWELSFKQLFDALANGGGSLAQNPKPNTAALDALKRMPGTSSNYVPLSFYQVSAGSSEQNFSASVADYVSNKIRDSSAQHTFWGKLISEYCPQFLFAISPAAERALPIPFCPALRWKQGGKVIEISDYSYANCNANLTQITESVTILVPLTSANGAVMVASVNATPSYPNVIEYPENNANADKPGLKLFKNPPEWYGKMGATIDGGSQAANDAVTTAQTNVGPATGGVTSAAQALLDNQPILKAFAKHWYLNEILQQRYGEIAGPLRLDIAPGSVVKIELPRAELYESNSLVLPGANPPEFIVASIMSVSYVINAERATAGTSFTIAHTKTETENASDDFSVDAPPLYPNAVWLGGPLAELKTP